ncbi:hypothetical protein BJ912DRAFT_36767 [Pholiota molesta]|nr:hypothetical protein BJ912DRAFT_36767 [Pholiota molesta]
MSRNTPWSHSSLPSDRIKPKGAPNVAKPKAKGKQQAQQPPNPPKSKNAQRIETLWLSVKNSTGRERDPKGGCFCLARIHGLSPYTPLCQSCGLILCSVNLPQYCCPHCASILMTPASRESLISQLDSELAATIAKEIAERERALEEAQRAAGAFPQLMASSSPSVAQPQTHASAPPPSRQTHKVLSLTGPNRRVLVSSYTTTPVPSRPVSRNEDAEEPQRVPHPPLQPPYAPQAPSSQRPWENLIDGSVAYQQRSRLDDESASKPSTRRRRGNKMKGKENDGAGGPSQGDGRDG